MNADYEKAIEVFRSIAGNNTDDAALAATINQEVDNLGLYYGDTAVAKITNNSDSSDAIKLQSLVNYSAEHPDAQMAYFVIANMLFDMKKFHEADSVATKLQVINGDFPNLDLFIAATKRELGDYDAARKIYDEKLEENQEDLGAITAKARVELKSGNDEEAARLVEQAMKIDPKNILVREADILCTFLSGKKTESVTKLNQMKSSISNPGDSIVYSRTAKVINGEVKYR
jgi:tetratricopeptide (TPR) repeat protein